tara:strand:- start:289 stop:519 length:231 start_codon:yes stop_codon:yes gene_type:complete
MNEQQPKSGTQYSDPLQSIRQALQLKTSKKNKQKLEAASRAFNPDKWMDTKRAESTYRQGQQVAEKLLENAKANKK